MTISLLQSFRGASFLFRLVHPFIGLYESHEMKAGRSSIIICSRVR